MFRKASIGRRLLCAAALCASLVAVLPALASAKAVVTKAAKSVTLGTRTLAQGMSGSDVQTLQRDLTSLGWPTVASGTFSSITTLHVKAFQRRYKISVDGVVGPQTVKELQSALGSVVETPDRTVGPQTVPADDSGGAGFVPADPQPGPPSTTTGTTGTGATGTGTTTGTTGTGTTTGTTGTGTTAPAIVPGTINIDGLAVPGAGAPVVIQDVIAAANQIALDPYVYGGGHNDDWTVPQAGYDCSGSVSYALHGGGLLAEPLDSTEFMHYGEAGPGRWITIFATDGHAFMEVDGLFFDTVNQQFTANADRWTTAENSWEKTQTYTEVHPAGW